MTNCPECNMSDESKGFPHYAHCSKASPEQKAIPMNKYEVLTPQPASNDVANKIIMDLHTFTDDLISKEDLIERIKYHTKKALTQETSVDVELERLDAWIAGLTVGYAKDSANNLRNAAVGKPAKIKWPHRVLHDGAETIDSLLQVIENQAKQTHSQNMLTNPLQIDSLEHVDGLNEAMERLDHERQNMGRDEQLMFATEDVLKAAKNWAAIQKESS